MIEVVEGGARTTIQDLGRSGYAHLGIPASGAADRASFTLANRLVGNPEGAAAFETTLTGPVLSFHRAATVALTGARVDATLDGRAVAMDGPVAVRAGGMLKLGTATRGLRTYVAVRGGLVTAVSFGSSSSDQLTGLGPAPLSAGDRITIGGDALGDPVVDVAPVAPMPAEPVLRVRTGPRDDWFAPDAVTSLLSETFRVQPEVDRIGVRLGGPRLQWREDRELRSEGMVTGAIQVPPSGDPIILLADHPTTGGYPVIAVVTEEDVAVAAQLVPGMSVHLRPV